MPRCQESEFEVQPAQKTACTLTMAKSRWGDGHPPELSRTVASGKGHWSWVCKAVISCGTLGLGVSEGGKIF